MRRLNFALAILMILSLFSLPLQSESANGQDKGWALLQRNPQSGDWYIYCNSTGLAAVNKKIGCTLVTRAPSWDVAIYNDRARTYYNSTYSKWKGESGPASVSGLSKAPKVDARRGATKMICGMHAVQYFSNNMDAMGTNMKTEIWTTTDISVPPQLSTILTKTYGFDAGNIKGMPLKMSYTDRGNWRLAFETLQCRREFIPAATFNYPAHYQRVDSEVAVFLDENKQAKVNKIMKELNQSPHQSEIRRYLQDSGNIPTLRRDRKSGELNVPQSDIDKYVDMFTNFKRTK